MDFMDFYHLKDDYIQFLRTYDSKVAVNKNESRPYVGVVLDVDGIKYYAPFSSPKPKHLHMRNTVDFRKIAGGRYGAINFNNMIPVPEAALLPISIRNEPDVNYRRILQNQYTAIMDDIPGIQRTAENLRNLLMKEDQKLSDYEKKVKSRCCDLVLLESVYLNWDV